MPRGQNGLVRGSGATGGVAGAHYGHGGNLRMAAAAYAFRCSSCAVSWKRLRPPRRAAFHVKRFAVSKPLQDSCQLGWVPRAPLPACKLRATPRRRASTEAKSFSEAKSFACKKRAKAKRRSGESFRPGNRGRRNSEPPFAWVPSTVSAGDPRFRASTLNIYALRRFCSPVFLRPVASALPYTT